MHELVEGAGAINVFGDLSQPSASVSLEAIVQRRPALVLLTGGDSAFTGGPAWQTIEAVRRRRFVVVEGTAFSYPSFRAPSAVAQLARALRERRGQP
jgi:ABC-type Fe3+-hydroxamate transport system substrate-binding protein